MQASLDPSTGPVHSFLNDTVVCRSRLRESGCGTGVAARRSVFETDRAASELHSKAHIDPGIGPAPGRLRVWPVRRQVFRSQRQGFPGVLNAVQCMVYSLLRSTYIRAPRGRRGTPITSSSTQRLQYIRPLCSHCTTCHPIPSPPSRSRRRVLTSPPSRTLVSRLIPMSKISSGTVPHWPGRTVVHVSDNRSGQCSDLTQQLWARSSPPGSLRCA